jgi:hypothetical protein
MFPIVIALIILALGIGAIYLLLKNMGEQGIEVAAPGSCKSGRCGVRCGPLATAREDQADDTPDEAGANQQRDPRKGAA